jgi:hypothetical protein
MPERRKDLEESFHWWAHYCFSEAFEEVYPLNKWHLLYFALRTGSLRDKKLLYIYVKIFSGYQPCKC